VRLFASAPALPRHGTGAAASLPAAASSPEEVQVVDGIHLVAFVAARGFLQVFQVSAPLLWTSRTRRGRTSPSCTASR